MTHYNHIPRECRCGSGKMSRWIYDGHGIELFRACDVCLPEKMKGLRPDIMEKYEADEPIEPEDKLAAVDAACAEMEQQIDENLSLPGCPHCGYRHPPDGMCLEELPVSSQHKLWKAGNPEDPK
jgi:hypothetical protein